MRTVKAKVKGAQIRDYTPTEAQQILRETLEPRGWAPLAREVA